LSVKTFVRLCVLLLFACPAGEARALCNVSATGINFGPYDVFVAAPLDSTGSVTVSCTYFLPRNVTVSIGASSTSGGFRPRRMRGLSGSDQLDYNLFTTASRSTIWGNGTAGTSTVLLSNVRRNQPRTATIYGRIPAGQDIQVGSYTDTVTVTILY
jgi:spore coat protein U-like protein